jgi:hypothetical protein
MATSQPRSLKHEYELFVEREIENYKDSVPRNALLAIGDEAVRVLSAQPQFELTELVLWEEVDRIIKQRLRVPSYSTWRRRRLRMLERYRRPEHWGIEHDAALVRAIQPAAEAHVLVAGPENLRETALYLAANGCEVTAVEQEEDAVERVMTAASAVGLTGLVHGCVADLGHWAPDSPLTAVVCTPAAFDGLSAEERDRVIALLQGATLDGGVHLVDTIAASNVELVAELRSQYVGWDISIESKAGANDTFLARKGVS